MKPRLCLRLTCRLLGLCLALFMLSSSSFTSEIDTTAATSYVLMSPTYSSVDGTKLDWGTFSSYPMKMEVTKWRQTIVESQKFSYFGHTGTGENNVYIDNTNSAASDVQFRLATAGTAYFQVYGDGRLVLGQSSPSYSSGERLDVDGNMKIKDVIKLVPRSSAPSSPSEGWIYYDSTTHKMYCRDNSAWQALW